MVWLKKKGFTTVIKFYQFFQDLLFAIIFQDKGKQELGNEWDWFTFKWTSKRNVLLKLVNRYVIIPNRIKTKTKIVRESMNKWNWYFLQRTLKRKRLNECKKVKHHFDKSEFVQLLYFYWKMIFCLFYIQH